MSYGIARFLHPDTGLPATALVDGDRVRFLPADLAPDVNGLIEHWAERQPAVEALAADGSGPWSDTAELTLLPPVEPRQIVQAGANYRTHVIDLVLAHREPDDPRSEEQARAETAAMMDRRAAEGTPYFFVGMPTALASATEDLVLPGYSDKHDWELELAVVIGRRAQAVSPAEALEHVFGYTVVNDITTRDLVFRKDMPEIGTDWYRSKNAPGFLPAGPVVVPAEFVGDPQDLRVTLRLNGQVMQDESTADMIFDVARLISAASRTMPLLPGDLLLTGSPAGNGMHWGRLLRAGDVMEATVTGLGTQTVRCVAGAA